MESAGGRWERAGNLKAKEGPLLIVVNRASMTRGHHEHYQPVLLQLADDTIIAYPIPPQSKLTGSKRFAEIARVRGRRNPRIHVIEDFPLDGAVELFEVLQGSMIVFNGPSQVLSALAGW